jgi:hypothetical protein
VGVGVGVGVGLGVGDGWMTFIVTDLLLDPALLEHVKV